MVLLSDTSSDISELSSDSPEADNDYDSPPPEEEPSLPPFKRQKLGDGSRASSSAHVEQEHPQEDPEPDWQGDISSDTSGDVPNSPINAKLDEEEFQEQVTVCAWDGCQADDLGNMDKLVEHIHNDHIESRQKKYTCEWVGCPRKSMPHASGYALKAHMRSHTREKPFYCYLPECDRAFTRSDALAKHMRTVHETEALRPSDPVPKSLQAQASRSNSKLKIILKTPQSHAAGHDDSVDDGDGSEDMSSEFFTALTEQQGFNSNELQMDIEMLWKTCVAHIRWASEEGNALRASCRDMEDTYRREWLEKEVLLDQVKSTEEAWFSRRRAVLTGAADVVAPPPDLMPYADQFLDKRKAEPDADEAEREASEQRQLQWELEQEKMWRARQKQ